MVGMVFNNFTVKEDILQTLPMKGHKIVTDVYNTFRKHAKPINLPLHKQSAITTNAAPAMVIKNRGFITLCKNDDLFKFYNLLLYYLPGFSVF